MTGRPMPTISVFEGGTTAGAAWRVVAVSALPDFRLRVRFVDDTEGEVDMAGFLGREQVGVFAPLRDPAVFSQVSVELGAVTWPGDLDLAPDAMYDAIRQKGAWVI
jgi:hypothetical protein